MRLMVATYGAAIPSSYVLCEQVNAIGSGISRAYRAGLALGTEPCRMIIDLEDGRLAVMSRTSRRASKPAEEVKGVGASLAAD
jgi:hypothetical protein